MCSGIIYRHSKMLFFTTAETAQRHFTEESTHIRDNTSTDNTFTSLKMTRNIPLLNQPPPSTATLHKVPSPVRYTTPEEEKGSEAKGRSCEVKSKSSH